MCALLPRLEPRLCDESREACCWTPLRGKPVSQRLVWAPRKEASLLKEVPGTSGFNPMKEGLSEV